MPSNEAAALALHESVWLDANRYYDAERRHYEISTIESRRRANPGCCPVAKPPGMSQSSLASEIAYARQKIQNFLKSEYRRVIVKQGPRDSKFLNLRVLHKGDAGVDPGPCTILNRLEKLEKGNEVMKKQVAKLTSDMTDVLSKLSTIEKFMKTLNNQVYEEVQASVKDDSKGNIQNGSSAVAADDDLDLFGSDEEDASAAKLREERLQAYASKKAKKPALVAKSSVVLDVKPWDDETDMKEMERTVRAIQSEGLVWGASKLVPLAYGINKLQIVAIVEDEKVSIDWLQETISEIEDLVQSVDIAAFNKL